MSSAGGVAEASRPSFITQGRRFDRVLWLVIILGCIARVLGLALDPEIYHDDAYLMNNALVKSYHELIGPLDNNQAAPPAFLWISKWLLSITGADWGARLFPFVAGMGTLLVFYYAAREMLSVLAARLATAWLAASHAPFIYTLRAKPYAIDMLVGACVLLLLLRWLRRPREVKYVVVMAVITPIVFWFSYTSMFVMAGAAIVTFLYAITHRTLISRALWPAWIGLALSGIVGGGLIHHYHLASCMSAQHTAYLHQFWADAFPPRNPLRFVAWLITTHMGRMYSYPMGENYLASFMPFLLWLAGIATLLRRHKRWLLAAHLVPQVLLLGAAVAGLYPYGGHPRVSLFLAPSICLLITVGTLQVTRWLPPLGRARFLTIVSLVLLLVPTVEIVGAVLQRIGEYRNGSIKHGLTALIDSRSPGDIFRRSSPPAPLGGGGSIHQISEYYLHLLPWPTSLTAPIPTSAARGQHLVLIRLLDPDQRVDDAPPDPLASQSPEVNAAWRLTGKHDLGPIAAQGQLVAFEYEPVAREPRP